MYIRKLLLRPAGMFSNVNEVIQQLFLAEQHKYKFIIDWSSSCYRDQKKHCDPWLYYFKPCFDITNIDYKALPTLKGGEPIACAKNNIITPRLYDGKCDSLLLPKDRSIGNRIISKYIIVNSHVQDEIDSFRQKFFHNNVVGLHIRGAGRLDGGAAALRKKHKLENGIPFSLYFSSVNRILDKYPTSKIFICSDSEIVINKVFEEYPNRVIFYDSTRSAFGEMHANHIENKGIVFPKYKLGLDVVVEAHLLSIVNYLVHGNSNVVNFVLCKNKELKHDYVYQDS